MIAIANPYLSPLSSAKQYPRTLGKRRTIALQRKPFLCSRRGMYHANPDSARRLLMIMTTHFLLTTSSPSPITLDFYQVHPVTCHSASLTSVAERRFRRWRESDEGRCIASRLRMTTSIARPSLETTRRSRSCELRGVPTSSRFVPGAPRNT